MTTPARMSEQPFFFARDDSRLFGVLHRGPDTSRGGLVMSHPLAEEKLWSHRVFVSMARALAARGFTVLRFDYAGAGDSSGFTPDTSLESHLADLAAATRALMEREPGLASVGHVGLRLGATFAALLVEEADRLGLPAVARGGPLVLWDPVVNGAEYLQEVMRSNLSAQLATHGKVIETREVLKQRILDGGIVNIDGYELARGLFESCDRADLLPLGAKRHGGPALVVAVTPAGKARARPDLEQLAASYPRGTFARADEEPFWREIKRFYARAENLEAVTLDWLEGVR